MNKLIGLSLIALQVLLTDLEVRCQGNNPLHGRSFRVQSIVREEILTGGQPMLTLSELTEEYSLEQGRANLQFSLLNRNSSYEAKFQLGRFQLDTRRLSRLLRSYKTTSCESASVESFQELIHFRPMPMSLDECAPEHVVGPARLLFYSANHRDQMRLVALGKRIRIRNVECLEYWFEIQTATKGRIHFRAFYSKLALASDPNSLPLMITLSEGSMTKALIFEFWNLQILDMEGAEFAESTSGREMMHDLFLTDLTKECIRALGDTAPGFIFSALNKSRSKLSFQARVIYKSSLQSSDSTPLRTRKANFFLAYDATLSSLTTFSELESNSDQELTRLLYNFRTGRMFLTKEHRLTATTRKQVLDLKDPDESSKCLATKINGRPESTDRVPVQLGELLVGSNSFVYMGRAFVRGLPALVYKSGSGRLPLWLDQPVNYRNGSGLKRTRLPEVGPVDNNGKSFVDANTNLLLYVTDSGSMGTDEFQLLHLVIELPRSTNELEERYDKLEVQFYDFHWDLPEESPSGERQASFFAAKESCFVKDSSKRVQIELVLEAERSTQGEQLFHFRNIFEVPLHRNRAIMGVLNNNLKLDPNAIQDLKSKLVQEVNMWTIQTSFSANIYSGSSVGAIYLGQGVPGISLNLKILPFVPNFRCCLLEATRIGSIYFGFSFTRMICYIDLTRPTQETLKKPQNFIMMSNSASSNTEIYRLELFPLAEGENGSDFLNSGNAANFLNSTVRLTDETSNSPYDNEDLAFRVRRLFRVTNGAGSDDRIPQVHLSPSGKSVVRVSSGGGEMNLDKCRLSCLSDLNCRAFSVCLITSQFECITTSLEVFQQRFEISKELQAKKSFTLEIGGELVDFVRHPSCELHKKNYLNLFVRSHEKRSVEISNRRLYKRDSLDACTQSCYENNMQILSEEKFKIETLISNLLESNKVAAWMEITSIHKALSRDLCDSIAFIGHDRYEGFDKNLRELVASRLVNDTGSNVTGGFCLLGSRAGIVERSDIELSESKQLNFEDYFSLGSSQVELYLLNLDIYYTRLEGIGLRASSKSETEAADYKQMTMKNVEHPEESSILRYFIERGENSQQAFIASEFDCAQKCFMQLANLWPACRSFDIVLKETADGRQQSHCYLNTMTLEDLKKRKKFDLIIDNFTTGYISHFEPKKNFALFQGTVESGINIIDRNQSNLVDPLATLAILIAGLAIGSIIGVQLSKRLLKRRLPLERHSNKDNEMLVRGINARCDNGVQEEEEAPDRSTVHAI